MKVAEYLLSLIVICTFAYLVMTPITASTASSLNRSAELIADATDGRD